MSSLAATQADGYYRPDLRHARRHRGASQFARTGKIRFELPHDGKCIACAEYYGKGTRFNAEKKAAGMYFTTKIWEFRMKCKTCAETLVVRTDPARGDYAFTGNLKRKIQSLHEDKNIITDAKTSEPSCAAHTNKSQGLTRLNISQGRDLDAMARLEMEQEQRRQTNEDNQAIKVLKNNASRFYKDDFTSNSRLRKGLRKIRHAQEDLLLKGTQLGIGGPLKPAEPGDTSTARAEFEKLRRDRRKRKSKKNATGSSGARGAVGTVRHDADGSHKRRRLQAVRKQSIFGSRKRSPSSQAKKIDAALQRVPRSSRLAMQTTNIKRNFKAL